MFRDLGWDAYHFTGPHGQNIQKALDYYAQYYAAYGSPRLASIPATGTIPDLAQYAGDVYTGSAAGSDVMGGDGLIWPYAIANTIYPGDTRIAAALNKDEALYEQEMRATGGRTAWLPASEPDIMSLVMQEAAGN